MRVTLAILPALALALAGCSGSPASGTGHGPVPWVDRPAPAYTPPPWVAPMPYPTSAPHCQAGQLRITHARSGVATGNILHRFTIENVGAATCLLGAHPSITGLDSNGVRRAVPVRHPGRGTFFGELVAADIAPGHRGYLDLATTDICASATGATFRRIALRLPSGGSISSRYSVTEGCTGLQMSGPGLPQPESRPPPRVPGSADTLDVGIALKTLTHVSAGSTVRFVVTLSDRHSRAVTLRPCPSYSEGVYTDRPVQRSYRLNCNAASSIDPHGRVSYAMRLTLPRTVTAGIAKLSWHLNTPNEPAATVVVMIDPAAGAGSG